MDVSCQVCWVVFLRINSERKVNRLLDRFAETIGHKIEVHQCECYWKDASLFRVAVMIQLPVDELSAAVSAVLEMCWALASRWTVVAPQIYHGARWEFSGTAISSTIAIEGLVDIDFRVWNGETSPTDSEAESVVQKESDPVAP